MKAHVHEDSGDLLEIGKVIFIPFTNNSSEEDVYDDISEEVYSNATDSIEVDQRVCNASLFCYLNDYNEDEIMNETWKSCYPKFVEDYSTVLSINICLLFLIGGLGNLLNLLSIPYVFFRYPEKFTIRWNQTTLLMLHLSLCDLAYITFGIPSFLNIYLNHGFTYSLWLCKFSALIRNLICYADFLTLGSIALVRMTADLSSNAQNEMKLTRTVLLCCSTWILSFGIISPMVLEAQWGGLDWGKFGPNPSRGACNTYSCNNSEASFSAPAIIYTVGFFFPFFSILIAYLLVLPIKMNKINAQIQMNSDDYDQFVDICKINKALWILFLSYVLFTAPLVAIEWLDATNLDETTIATANVIGHHWYFWIYAVNFIVYLASLEDFRAMYVIFLKDCFNLTKRP